MNIDETEIKILNSVSPNSSPIDNKKNYFRKTTENSF